LTSTEPTAGAAGAPGEPEGAPGAVDRHLRSPGVNPVPAPHVPYWPEHEVGLRSLAGAQTRLLIPDPFQREDLAAYTARGGYQPGDEPGKLIEKAEQAGLAGRGGAAFPLGIKLRSVRDAEGPRYVVANGEEGEPLSVKDRWLLRIRPHLVLDGLFRAAGAVSAGHAYVYLSDPDAAASVRHALAELGDVPLPVEVVRIEPSYVGGEETAVVRAINGGPALPVDKPPRPFESGVGERPTLISNVETLANLPAIDVHGVEAYVQPSRDRQSPGTFLLSLSGACAAPGLYEVPLGMTLREVADQVGGFAGEPRGALMGGYFAGLIGPDVLDLPLSYPATKARGTGLGCGAIWVIAPDECPIAIAADLMAYFERNNARQCGPCIRGTGAMAKVLERLSRGEVTDADIERLTGWSQSLRGRGACAYLDGSANLAASVFREFSADVAAHRDGPCPICAQRQAAGYDRFRLTIEQAPQSH
jgi:NADH:ubiquinone oxidoreductase subunit F (NADH-binding)